MYLAVDVGGSKTFVAVLDSAGQILQQERFKTDKHYPIFIKELQATITKLAASYKIQAACVAMPGRIDRKTGTVLAFGNLPWHNLAIKSDIAKVLAGVPIFIENDAKLAGLSEATLVHDKYKKVLYLTISTGIGDGLIINGIIDPDFADNEPGQMVLENNGKLQKWEDFASGRALKEQTGQLASQITDERIWYKFSKGLAKGIDVLVATMDPEVIVIGGGVGAHFSKFGHFLVHELKKYENNLIKMPPVVAAKRPEEAVVYGCYELIRQKLAKD